MTRLVNSLKKSVIAKQIFHLLKPISIEESAKEIASSCLLAMTRYVIIVIGFSVARLASAGRRRALFFFLTKRSKVKAWN